MSILLDTHIYIWWLDDSKKLSKGARDLIQNTDIIYVSAISLVEMAVKIRLGKIEANMDHLTREISASGFKELPLMSTHAKILSTLPCHHRDPFDRMLIAQALSEPLHFLTADKALATYSELVMVM